MGDCIVRWDDHFRLGIGSDQSFRCDEEADQWMADGEDHRSCQDHRAVDRASSGKYVRPAALERAEGEDDDEDGDAEGRGICFGITLHDIRTLCDNPWDGGGGYTPHEVSKMTPDQVYMRLCDKKLLKRKKAVRTSPRAPADMSSGDGLIKGRAKDGTEIQARMKIGGKSVARRLMEEEKAKRLAVQEDPKVRRRLAREARQRAREERSRMRSERQKAEQSEMEG